MAGSATDSDGTIASHVWTKYSGPSTYTITDANSYTTTITGLIAGTYVFRLTATDDDGATGYDDITIVVNASGGITYATLSPTDKSSYVALSNGDLTATFTRDELDNVRSTISKTSGKWYWESSATSIGGSYLHVGSLSGSGDLLEGYTAGQLDGVAVNVNGDYYVDNSYIGNLGVTITNGTIVGSALDMDSHTYYIYVSGTLRATVTGWYKSGHSYFGAADTWHNPGITTLNFGQSSFTYSPPSGFNSGLYTIANATPLADAGPNQSITLPTDYVTMAGSATDSDGTIASHVWTKYSGPSTYTITDANSYTTTITGLIAGTYVFRLTATDDDGATHSDDMTVTVSATNIPPTANAGSGQSIVLPTSSVTVSGSGSLDSDGTIVSYSWSFISGPNTPSITSPSSVSTDITDMTVSGAYTFRLVVTDDDGATDSDDIDILVSSQSSSSGGRGGGMIITGLQPQCINCELVEKNDEQPISTTPGSDGIYNPLVSVTALKLNVRSDRNFLSPIVTVISQYTIVEVIDNNLYNAWVKIRTPDGIEGFIRAKFIKWYFVKPNDKASITTEQLNVRSLDSVKSDSLKILTPTDIVDVISVSAKTVWAKIRTIDGLIGYANKFLLRVLILR
jgi:hypothetical protein